MAGPDKGPLLAVVILLFQASLEGGRCWPITSGQGSLEGHSQDVGCFSPAVGQQFRKLLAELAAGWFGHLFPPICCISGQGWGVAGQEGCPESGKFRGEGWVL